MKGPDFFEVTFFKGVKHEPKNKYADYAYLFRMSDDFGTWEEKKTTHYKEEENDD